MRSPTWHNYVVSDVLPTPIPEPIIFYDGVCALCNGFVRFLLFADKAKRFYFAPLQGDAANQIAQQKKTFPRELESIVLWQDNQLLLRSRAIFSIFQQLPWPWRMVSWFRIVPTIFTDAIYVLVAKIRYRVIGRYDVCPVPPAQVRSRFLS